LPAGPVIGKEPISMRLSLVAAFLLYVVTSGLYAETASTDVSTISPGSCRRIDWQTRLKPLPVVVCRRTEAQLKALGAEEKAWSEPDLIRSVADFAYDMADAELAGEVFAMQQSLQHKAARSVRNEFLVVIAIDPYIGCSVKADFAHSQKPFFNPCHDNTFDDRGRLLNSRWKISTTHPLRIPPHYYKGDTLVLGELDPAGNWVHYDFRPNFNDPLRSDAHRLMLAAHWGELSVMTALLKHDLDVDSTTSKQGGVTALMVAVSTRQYEAVRWLLKRGADPDAESQGGVTPLQLATLAKDKRMIALLKASGATNPGRPIE
jgi:Rieske Fe-S protein